MKDHDFQIIKITYYKYKYDGADIISLIRNQL